MRTPSFRISYAVLLVASVSAASASLAADIRVFSSGAPANVARVLAERFTRDIGDRVEFTVANPAGIQEKLRSGETPDIVLLPGSVVDGLEKSGALRPGSRSNVARVGVGVVVRTGAPLPDVSTADAVRKALLDARSIVCPDPIGGGVTGPALARMMEQLGIADAVRPRITLRQAIAGGVELVAKGEVELGLFNISEVLPVKGVTLVGPLPADIQNYTIYAAGIGASAKEPDAANALLKALAGPGAAEVLKSKGMDPP